MSVEITAKRSLSIDVFRAITMFLMLLVNDLSEVKNMPSWIDHAAEGIDGLGFADTVFPAFMFIVGLSLPFAINKRMRAGASFINIIGYIFYRSFALIIMGIFQVNMESYNNESTLPYQVWGLIVTVSFFLIWLDYPTKISNKVKNSLILIGYLLLVLMAFLYLGDNNEHFGMHTQWGGILGIIGWGYLPCAILYYLLRGNLRFLIALLVVFAINSIICHMNLTDIRIWLIGDASSVTLVMAGVVAGLLHSKYRFNFNKLIYTYLLSATLLIITGFIVRPYAGGISKDYSTSAWVFICTGISLLIFVLLILLIDKKQKSNWFKWIMPAGTSSLTCYLLPYIITFLMMLLHLQYPAILKSGILGILRCVFMTIIIIFIATKLEKINLRLKV